MFKCRPGPPGAGHLGSMHSIVHSYMQPVRSLCKCFVLYILLFACHLETLLFQNVLLKLLNAVWP